MAIGSASLSTTIRRWEKVEGEGRSKIHLQATLMSVALHGREDLDLGTAGAGARREFERRRARREARTRERHPRIGGLLLRLQAPPRSEEAWESGAIGEEALAAHLAARCPDVVVLHDRRMPGSRANIDHLAVAPSGVFVIDAKCHKGRIEVRRPLLDDAVLVIAGARGPSSSKGSAVR